MKKLLPIIAALLLAAAATAAEEYRFRLIDTNSGLPDNNVRNMVMLPNGLMCIQTSTMLNLYNGTACSSYHYNPIEIPYNEYSGLSNAYYDAACNRLWCTSRDKTWYFDLDRRRFCYDVSTCLHDYTPDGLDAVAGFFIDSENNYWVVDTDSDIMRCNPSAHTAENIGTLEGMNAPVVMTQIGESIWMLSLDGMLAEYDTSVRTFRSKTRIPISGGGTPSRMDMVRTSKGNLWIMFDRDLVLFDTTARKAVGTGAVPLGRNDIYTTIAIDADDNLWVGSARSGVSIVDGSTMRARTLPWLEQTDGSRIYHHTDISKIYVDPRGGVWIATLAEGLLYWHRDIIRLNTVDDRSLAGGKMTDESVKCMVEDRDGTILVGTIDGLMRYNPEDNTITIPYPRLRHELCISLFRDSHDRIWLGTFNNGAFCIDNGGIRHYIYPEMSTVDISYYDSTPNFNCVRTFYEQEDGTFWISVYGGIGRFDVGSGRIDMLRDEHPELDRFMIIRDICDHGDGRLLCMGDNGRFLYSPSEDRVYTDSRSADCHTPSNQALVDSHGMLWIATSDGVAVTDPESGRRYRVTMKDGLPNDNILSLAADGIGNIWVATFSHIARIKPVYSKEGVSFAVSTFGPEDGVTASAFFQKSLVTHSGGDIYFGGAHGICEITPSKLYQSNYGVRPLISSLQIFGQQVDVGDEYNGRCILDTDLEHIDHIDLRHDESFLTFEFSSLNYANPSHTSYRYILENFDREWTEIRSRDIGRATYTFLQPGDYVFRVQSADNDNDWSRECAELHITIHPPFWRSTAACTLYALLFVLSGYLAALYMRRRMQRRSEYRRTLEMQQQREELDQMKFRFFINISHELRTPLSLIILPLESIIRRSQDSPLLPQLQSMHDNAQQLLSLVNHLLDFRKLEMGGEKLSLVRNDIAEFTEAVLVNFRYAMQRKNLTLEFENKLRNGMMRFDPTQMQKIINNLLSNAMKFTPEGGGIFVRLTESDGTDLNGAPCRMMTLEVSDTGTGIPAYDLDKIFDRFYQSDDKRTDRIGSGIGLHIVRQYAEMHKGTVSAASEQGHGATFRVSIPMNLGGTAQAEPTAEETETDLAPAGDTAGKSLRDERTPTLLIIDDHADFRQYMADELAASYTVLQAEDGMQGLKTVHRSRPDVVICDVMMPNIDGIEFTRRLKNDIETSHIPVILLTARADDDIRRDGYETGADAYLTKPFKMEILEARIRNLIEERRRRISVFSSNIDVQASQITGTSIDEKLMQRIMACMERNMDNPEFSVEELSSEVGMHRMNLYRKLQSIAGVTPSEFIRTMRLKRAAQILRENSGLSVSEVSDMVGFNTTKYFTRYFREMFGVTPSQYAQQYRKE